MAILSGAKYKGLQSPRVSKLLPDYTRNGDS